jgi:hypothetical protein
VPSGHLAPLPLRLGSNVDNDYSVVLSSLLEQYGTSVSSDPTSVAYLEAVCDARAIVYLHRLRQKLANQFDMQKTTDFLPRWVQILGIPVEPNESDASKRRKLILKESLRGLAPTQQVVRDLLEALLGDVFVEVHHYDATEATGSAPGGLAITGGATLIDGPWSSGCCHLGIELQRPTAMSDVEFRARSRSVDQWLTGFLPAWTTWSWFVNGPDGDGFWLDQDYNLDYQAL